jgi:hypothetical protein
LLECEIAYFKGKKAGGAKGGDSKAGGGGSGSGSKPKPLPEPKVKDEGDKKKSA